MSGWIGPLSFAISGAALLLSMMGLWFTAVISGLDRWNRRYFQMLFFVFLLCELLGLLETAFQHYNVPAVVFIVLLSLETLLLALPLLMDLNSGPLCISIRTQHSDSGTDIIVEDNGRGIDPTGKAEPGIALENIRQRLEMMCSGSLTITPGEGGGTIVTVTIPDSATQ